MLARIYQRLRPTQAGYRDAVKKGINLSEYRQVFLGVIKTSDVREVPELISASPKASEKCREFRESDIVEVLAPGTHALYYLDRRRFRKLPRKFAKAVAI